MLQGQKLPVMAQVPFAEDRGGVAAAATELGERHFIRMNAMLRTGIKCTQDAHAFWIAAGQQGDARRGAHSRRGMEVGEHATLVRHSIEMRRFVGRCPKWADVGVAHVVDEKNDDVGRRVCVLSIGLLRTADVRSEQRRKQADCSNSCASLRIE